MRHLPSAYCETSRAMEENYRTHERQAEKRAEDVKTTARKASGECPHCGTPLENDKYEICPVCGGKLVDYCTFCGAPMRPDDVDCPECGMPSEGVICPTCNIRNFRSFCRQCSQPLSRAARKAVEKARQDPKVHEATRLMSKLAELEAELEASIPDEDEEEPQGPTEGELRLREIMAKVGFTPAQKPKVTKRRIGRSRQEILAEYQKAIDEANKVFEEMLAPQGSTPQEQRNYYTARKVAVMEVIEHTWYGIKKEDVMCWECNRCHVLHNNPQNCAVREFGGKWIRCSSTEIVAEGTPGAQKFTEKVGERKVYKRE